MNRSRLKSRWSSVEAGSNFSEVSDLETAPMPHSFHRSSQPRVDLPPPKCSPVPKTVLFVFLFLLAVFFLHGRRVKTASGESIRWRSQGKLTSTSGALSNRTSAPKGRPLQISSLSNPPRIDKMKIMGRLAKLETLFRDEDLNEDMDEVADDLRQTYGLSRWPPLISHIPSISGLVNEEYTSDVADEALCSTTPCKFLLPVWTRPLSPARQLVQMQQLVNVAKRLGRTLVLPNVGPAHGETEESFSLGTCHRNPIARYFDISKLLLNRFGGRDDRSPKLAVPMHSFSEWVKYRPIHPSAQVVVIESSPSNETYEEFSLTGGAEIRIDAQMGRGRGKHKNCLSSKASKLKFANHSAFVVTPERQASIQSASELEHITNQHVESGQVESSLRYSNSIISFLTGDTISSDDAVCSTVSGLFYEFENPDVLVMEWDLETNLNWLHPSSAAEHDGLTPMTLDYSPRLYSLAASILFAVQRPLIFLRSESTFPAYSNYSPRIRANPSSMKSVGSQLQEIVRDLYPTAVAETTLIQEENVGDVLIDTDTVANRFLVNETEIPKSANSLEKSGTIWFGSDFTRQHSLTLARPASRSEEPDEAFSSDLRLRELLDSTSENTFDNFSLVDISTAISRLTTRRLLALRKHGILEDKYTLSILEDIIERRADRVVIVGNKNPRFGDTSRTFGAQF
ncbi:hypothetical protein A7U60_g4692 [Sanghuangporus baumii]|uniref:Uncharacterized protein n=1 Tax=Sanghuangporus baumii TaxID=108892 RepID=A0A9Q5NC45_SANBA|nr:hypothetical protein A7U60_g4692 [Sanghuangporus baumii]